MNKKMWLSVFALVILMFPAVVGAKTCYDGNGALYTGPDASPPAGSCPSYVDVTEMGSTTSTTIVGTWRWINNNDYEIRDNKYIYDGGVMAGTWALSNGTTREHTLIWFKGYQDTLILSLDGLSLNGHNQYGQTVTANRIGGSAHSPCMASLDKSLSLHIPNLEYAVAMWGTQYFAVNFDYDPFLATTSSGIYFKMDDYSIVSDLLCSDLSTPKLLVNGTNLDIRIPDVMLTNGTHIWVGLRYDATRSSATQSYFYVYLFATP